MLLWSSSSAHSFIPFCILISHVVVLQGVETDLQKKSHTMDKLQHEGQALMDSVDSGKEDIDSQAKAIKERWDKVNDGQLHLCSPFCAAECCCVAAALPIDFPPKLVLCCSFFFLNKVFLVQYLQGILMFAGMTDQAYSTSK